MDELRGIAPEPDWQHLVREATSSVLASHRQGRPFEVIEGHIQRPPPPEWLCQGLLLKNKPNCWLGAASTGKSTLAKAMCAHYASGKPFLGRKMGQGTPLYLDWEDDRMSFERTVYDVCQSLNVYPLPRMLWHDMHGYRLRDQVERLGEIVDEYHIGLLVLDAVAAAGGGAGEHVTWEDVALEMERCLGSLPPVTVLALDHVTGAEHKAGQGAPVPIKARGAERKLEYLRNQWSLVTDEGAEHEGRHVIQWHHTKNSVGRKEWPGFATEIVHGASRIEIVLAQVERPPVPTIAPDTKTAEYVRVLAETSGRTVHDLCLQIDGKEPSKARYNDVRTSLERAIVRGLVWKETLDQKVVYRVVLVTDTAPVQGSLIPFPGALG
jgi:hypothetical protein